MTSVSQPNARTEAESPTELNRRMQCEAHPEPNDTLINRVTSPVLLELLTDNPTPLNLRKWKHRATFGGAIIILYFHKFSPLAS